MVLDWQFMVNIHRAYSIWCVYDESSLIKVGTQMEVRSCILIG